jgi:hypothetical protein
MAKHNLNLTLARDMDIIITSATRVVDEIELELESVYTIKNILDYLN